MLGDEVLENAAGSGQDASRWFFFRTLGRQRWSVELTGQQATGRRVTDMKRMYEPERR